MTSLSPPVSPQPRELRPRVGHRTSTMASVTSNRSWRSSGSNKLELVETSRDKRRLNTKADPTQALSEAQPAAIALEESNLDNLRNVQHKDNEGNVITDPDRSNPTRHRLERPLDTIRAFNAAADGTTYRRSSYTNKPSPAPTQDNRRSSYYSNGYSQPPLPRQRPGAGPSNSGYHRNSSYGFRPENSFPDDVPHPPYGRPPRNQNQNQFQNQNQGHYDNGESPGSRHSYGHSYETMTSGSEEYGKSTNPSSQNSSFDQLHQVHHQRKLEEQQQQYMSQYDDDIQFSNPTTSSNGIHNYAQQTPNDGYPQQSQQYQQPRPPQHSHQQQRYNPPPSSYNQRQPSYLTKTPSSSNPSAGQQGYTDKPLPPQKRQSWIKRTFSRRGT